MKRTIAVYAGFVLLLLGSACGKDPKTPAPQNEEKFSTERLYVLGANLSLRESPSLKAKRINLIKYGAWVYPALKQSYSENFTVAGITGRWLKVRLNKQTGYLFSGYLSKLPAPRGVTTPEAYVQKYLRRNGAPKKISAEQTEHPWTKGVSLITTEMKVSGTVYRSSALLLKEASPAEAFLFGRALFAQGGQTAQVMQASFTKSRAGSIWEIQRESRNVKIVPQANGFLISMGETAD